jgi:hypothetical protein
MPMTAALERMINSRHRVSRFVGIVAVLALYGNCPAQADSVKFIDDVGNPKRFLTIFVGEVSFYSDTFESIYVPLPAGQYHFRVELGGRELSGSISLRGSSEVRQSCRVLTSSNLVNCVED